MNDDVTPVQSNPQRPTTNATPHARVGLYFALVGAGLILAGLLMSLPMLFFSPLIMCGVTLFTIPISLMAIVFGWKGRRDNPKSALAAILVGLTLTPAAFALAWYLGELIFQATN